MASKKLMSIVLLGILSLGNSVSAQTIQNVTPQEMLITPFTASPVATTAVKSSDLIQNTVGIVSRVIVDEATVRREPNPDSDIVNYIGLDNPVFVTERVDNWYHVNVAGVEGYVFKGQLSEDTLTMVPYTSTAPEVKETKKGEEVVAYAKQFLGNPYVYGGTSLTNGADCSGFVQQVYKNFGIKLERSSRSQYSGNGYKVNKNEMQPGDLIFYGYNGYIDHVAIYAGNDQIVHASTPKTGITMGDVYYGKPIIGIKRIFE